MPLLRAADFTDVPVYRIGDRAAVFDGVSGVWYHPSDGEMAVFHVLDRNPDGDRSACAAVARRGELAGLCGGTDVFGVCATRQRIREDSDGKIPASTTAGIRGGDSGRSSRSCVRDVSDAAGGEFLGKRDWARACFGAVPQRLEEWSGETRQPAGTGHGTTIAMGDSEAIPVAAGDVSRDWGAGDRVWQAVD